MSDSTVRAYVGLGSNLNDPVAQVRAGLADLQALPATRLVAASSLYRSHPMGPQDQPDYINAVVCLDTALAPEPLLASLQRIERAHHRQRQRHWGPRTLDLDLLLYGDQVSDDVSLCVPHPGITERNFVVVPLLEIEPDLVIPGHGPLLPWAERLGSAGLERLASA